MTDQKKVEIINDHPFNGYVQGLGYVTIVHNRDAATAYVEMIPSDPEDGTVLTCLEEWAKTQRERIHEQMKDVQKVERFTRLMRGLREWSIDDTGNGEG